MLRLPWFLLERDMFLRGNVQRQEGSEPVETLEMGCEGESDEDSPNQERRWYIHREDSRWLWKMYGREEGWQVDQRRRDTDIDQDNALTGHEMMLLAAYGAKEQQG